jgi:hypothetical protein
LTKKNISSIIQFEIKMDFGSNLAIERTTATYGEQNEHWNVMV